MIKNRHNTGEGDDRKPIMTRRQTRNNSPLGDGLSKLNNQININNAASPQPVEGQPRLKGSRNRGRSPAGGDENNEKEGRPSSKTRSTSRPPRRPPHTRSRSRSGDVGPPQVMLGEDGDVLIATPSQNPNLNRSGSGSGSGGRVRRSNSMSSQGSLHSPRDAAALVPVVCCRVRPQDGDVSHFRIDSARSLTVHSPEKKGKAVSARHNATANQRNFEFSRVIAPDQSQREVFENTAKPLVDSLFMGESGLLFAYGVTNSGKTYTIMGNESAPGVVPRAIDRVFDTLAERKEEAARAAMPPPPALPAEGQPQPQQQAKQGDEVPMELAVEVSYLEIYNEECYDLLEGVTAAAGTGEAPSTPRKSGRPSTPRTPRTPSTPRRKSIPRSQSAKRGSFGTGYSPAKPQQQRQRLQIQQSGARVQVAGLSRVRLLTREDATRVLRKGQSNLQMAGTLFNDHSSRSHAVFTLHLVEKQSGTELSRVALVDLAGSERVHKAAVSGETSHTMAMRRGAKHEIGEQRLKESNNINTSLMQLGLCITALANKAKNPNQVVNYRNSKLTSLFRDALQGKEQLVMIANINPARSEYQETLMTLGYAAVTKNLQLGSKKNGNSSRRGDTPRNRLRWEQEKKALLGRVKELEGELARHEQGGGNGGAPGDGSTGGDGQFLSFASEGGEVQSQQMSKEQQAEVARLNAMLEEAHAELAELCDKIRAVEAERDASDAKAASYLAERDAARASAAESSAALREAKANAEAAQRDLGEARADMEQLVGELRDVRQGKQHLQKRLEEAQQDARQRASAGSQREQELVARLDATQKEAQAMQDSLAAELSEASAEVARLEAQSREAAATVEQLAQAKAASEEASRDAEQQSQAALDRALLAEARQAETEVALRQAVHDAVQAQDALDAAQQATAAMKRDLEATRDSVQAMEASVREARQQERQALQSLEHAQAGVESCQAKLAEATGRAVQQADEVLNLHNDVATMQRKEQDLQAKLSEVQARLKAERAELTSLRKEVGGKATTLAQAVTDSKQLQQELASARATVASQEKQLAEMTRARSEAEEAMAEHQDNNEELGERLTRTRAGQQQLRAALRTMKAALGVESKRATKLTRQLALQRAGVEEAKLQAANALMHAQAAFKSQLDQSVVRQQEELMALQQEHSERVHAIGQAHKQEIADLIEQQQEQLSNAQTRDKHELGQQHAHQLEVLKASHAKRVEKMQAQGEQQQTSLREEHAEAMRQIQQFHEAEVTALHSRVAELEGAVRAAEAAQKVQQQEQQQQHEKNVQNLKQAHAQELAELQKSLTANAGEQSEAALAAARAQHEQAVSQLSSQHQEALSAMQQKWEETRAEAAALRADGEALKQAVIELGSEADSLKHQLDEGVAALRQSQDDAAQALERAQADFAQREQEKSIELEQQKEVELQELQQQHEQLLAAELEAARKQGECLLQAAEAERAQAEAELEESHKTELANQRAEASDTAARSLQRAEAQVALERKRKNAILERFHAMNERQKQQEQGEQTGDLGRAAAEVQLLRSQYDNALAEWSHEQGVHRDATARLAEQLEQAQQQRAQAQQQLAELRATHAQDLRAAAEQAQDAAVASKAQVEQLVGDSKQRAEHDRGLRAELAEARQQLAALGEQLQTGAASGEQAALTEAKLQKALSEAQAQRAKEVHALQMQLQKAQMELSQAKQALAREQKNVTQRGAADVQQTAAAGEAAVKATLDAVVGMCASMVKQMRPQQQELDAAGGDEQAYERASQQQRESFHEQLSQMSQEVGLSAEAEAGIRELHALVQQERDKYYESEWKRGFGLQEQRRRYEAHIAQMAREVERVNSRFDSTTRRLESLRGDAQRYRDQESQRRQQAVADAVTGAMAQAAKTHMTSQEAWARKRRELERELQALTSDAKQGVERMKQALRREAEDRVRAVELQATHREGVMLHKLQVADTRARQAQESMRAAEAERAQIQENYRTLQAEMQRARALVRQLNMQMTQAGRDRTKLEKAHASAEKALAKLRQECVELQRQVFANEAELEALRADAIAMRADRDLLRSRRVPEAVEHSVALEEVAQLQAQLGAATLRSQLAQKTHEQAMAEVQRCHANEAARLAALHKESSLSADAAREEARILMRHLESSRTDLGAVARQLQLSRQERARLQEQVVEIHGLQALLEQQTRSVELMHAAGGVAEVGDAAAVTAKVNGAPTPRQQHRRVHSYNVNTPAALRSPATTRRTPLHRMVFHSPRSPMYGGQTGGQARFDSPATAAAKAADQASEAEKAATQATAALYTPATARVPKRASPPRACIDDAMDDGAAAPASVSKATPTSTTKPAEVQSPTDQQLEMPMSPLQRLAAMEFKASPSPKKQPKEQCTSNEMIAATPAKKQLTPAQAQQRVEEQMMTPATRNFAEFARSWAAESKVRTVAAEPKVAAPEPTKAEDEPKRKVLKERRDTNSASTTAAAGACAKCKRCLPSLKQCLPKCKNKTVAKKQDAEKPAEEQQRGKQNGPVRRRRVSVGRRRSRSKVIDFEETKSKREVFITI